MQVLSPRSWGTTLGQTVPAKAGLASTLVASACTIDEMVAQGYEKAVTWLGAMGLASSPYEMESPAKETKSRKGSPSSTMALDIEGLPSHLAA